MSGVVLVSSARGNETRLVSETQTDMLVLTDPIHTQQITDPFVRQHCDMIFSECFSDDGLYGEPYDPVQHGYIVVVQPGDTVEAIQEITGIDLLLDPFTGARFPDPRLTSRRHTMHEIATATSSAHSMSLPALLRTPGSASSSSSPKSKVSTLCFLVCAIPAASRH